MTIVFTYMMIFNLGKQNLLWKLYCITDSSRFVYLYILTERLQSKIKWVESWWMLSCFKYFRWHFCI